MVQFLSTARKMSSSLDISLSIVFVHSGSRTNNSKWIREVPPGFTECLLESLEMLLTLNRIMSLFMAVSVGVLQEADTR